MRFYTWALEDPPEDEMTVLVELGEARILAGEQGLTMVGSFSGGMAH